MRTIITTIALIAPLATAAFLLLGMNDTASAVTVATDASTFATSPWILIAGLFGLVGLSHARQH